MPALWPIVLVAAHTAMAEVPKLNVGPSCKAAAMGTGAPRPQAACEHDENQARAVLEKQWSSFPVSQRKRCNDLTNLDGSPSYVELLTCLQAAAEASKLPKKGLEGPVK